ncbi:MAG: hypothetical protein ACT4PX_08770 [Actinomycetota bacterium]
MPRRKLGSFRSREIVRVVHNERTETNDVAGLIGTICGVSSDSRRVYSYAVLLPRRRRKVYAIKEEDLESTGRFEPPPPEDRSPVTLRVKQTGEATVVHADGTTSGIEYPDETDGLPFFNVVHFSSVSPGLDGPIGTVIGKARGDDGEWHYAVLLDDDRQVVGPVQRDLFRARFWTEPGPFLDGPRPPGLDELEARLPGHFLGAWQAPAPAFGYDQEVRVADRPHTDVVAGRVGNIVGEVLHDDLTWGYDVALHDDPGAEYRTATVAEEDLEPTGGYGEGYNPPPAWLG